MVLFFIYLPLLFLFLLFSVMVKDGLGKEYSIDGYLFNSFTDAKGVMNKRDVDLPILVSGYPGTGKSTLTMQLATFCDPTFTEERMCQTTEEFIRQIKIAKPLQAVALDESFEDLNASDIRKEMGRILRNLLNIIRQKNLYIFLIIPNFFDMGKSVAIFRTRWLIHCYDRSFGDIGYFVAFNRDTKHKLYIYGKRNEDYNATRGDFFGSFSAFIPTQINYEKYLKNKAKAIDDIKFTKGDTPQLKRKRDHAIVQLRTKYNFKVEEIAELFQLTLKAIYNVLNNYEKEQEAEEYIKKEAQKPQIKKRFSGKVRK